VENHKFPRSEYIDNVGTNLLGDLLVVAASDSLKVLRSIC
jgi:hypothetical protein